MASIRRSCRKSTVAQTLRSEAAAATDDDIFSNLEEPDVDENEGRKCEIQMYEVRYNSRGEAILLQSGCRAELELETDNRVEAALVLTRYYAITKELESTQLEIRSPHIKMALKEVIGSYPGVNINSKGPIIIPNEPWCLFHYRDELNEYAIRLRDKKAKEHIRFCLQYMSRVLRREIASYASMIQQGGSQPGIEFQDLWMVFKPEGLLYQKAGEIDNIYRLRQIVKNDDDGFEFWQVCMEFLSCDGKDFGYLPTEISIPHYDGYKQLTELNIFPLAYHPEQKLIRKKLLARGKKYSSLLGIVHCMYKGTVDEFSSPYTVRGRIIVDSKEYIDNVLGKKINFISGSKIIRINSGETFSLCDDDLLICQHWVPGFTLATKRWAHFNVSNIEPVEYNKDAFDSLILPPKIKKTLSSLVQLQEAQASHFDDLIVGKGKGLIILLHGLPGVGKTFTAESIADYSQRPLYVLGKADFGRTFFDNPERHLMSTLAKASRWNAIVLLDEADVFMQERSVSEMSRNEQVSILLRILEYFEGTMFLTTNRAEAIDSAFKSRIHLALTYPALSVTARSDLWETFILRGTDQHRPRWLTTRFLRNISREEVNGREIKNIVRVAHALALNDKRPMQANDVLQGLRSRKNFERDFNETASKRRLDENQRSDSCKRAKLYDKTRNEEEEGEVY